MLVITLLVKTINIDKRGIKMKAPKCKDIPLDLWPPKDSAEQNLEVFRLTQQKGVVLQSDFLSIYEINKRRNRINQDNLRDISYYGVSLFSDIDDANNLLRKMGWKFKDISQGITKSSDGCLRKEPSKAGQSHLDWWLYEDATPEDYFTILGESDDE